MSNQLICAPYFILSGVGQDIGGIFVVNKSVILETKVARNWRTTGLAVMQDMCLGKPLLLRHQFQRV